MPRSLSWFPRRSWLEPLLPVAPAAERLEQQRQRSQAPRRHSPGKTYLPHEFANRNFRRSSSAFLISRASAGDLIFVINQHHPFRQVHQAPGRRYRFGAE